MTQREFFNVIANGTGTISFKAESGNTNFKDITRDDPEIVEFATQQIEALGKKNSARNAKAKEKKDAVNAPLLAQINELLADGKAHTCAEIAAYTGANSPKIAALVKPFVDNGTVVKETVKNGKNRAIAYKNAAQAEEKGD